MSADLRAAAQQAFEDKAVRQRLIARSIWFTVPGTYLLLGVTYALIPPLQGLEETSARLVLATRWLLVAMIPYAAVCIVIATARFFEGAHNPLLGQESECLKIACRVMQNTLEQLVWFALSVVALATYLTPAQARIIPIVCSFFAGARFVYWWGYLRSDTLGRAPGVQLTFALKIAVLVLALVLFVRDLIS